MEMSAAAKVGMVAVMALILLGLVVTQIGGGGNERGQEYYVSFQNVGGLQKKAPVLLAGVKVGVVKNLELNPEDSRVKVTILITNDDVKLFRSRRTEDPSDSFYVYTIAGNLLDLYQRIVAIGDDIDRRGSKLVGSLLIESMQIAGT